MIRKPDEILSDKLEKLESRESTINRRGYPAVLFACAPTGIRTPVLALKGLRPSPLDDGGSDQLSLGILNCPK
jgi:hypothetical protein